MSKRLLSAALIAGLGLAFGANAATANSVSNSSPDGSITITGTVVGQTCKVDGKSAGTADAISVALPTVLTSNLASAGATAGQKQFSIGITGCDAALSTVQTYFSGTNIDTTTGNLSNNGSAANVQVQLLNADASAINLGGADASAQNSQTANLDATGSATLDYTAQYIAQGGAAGSGDVNTSVQFTMVYN
ncbi:fimbrial protein [Frateuria soli]|uniref:fimbrial protein n=1 Tax=Frateuria soli TaxID=1542730 RepID=UPI001E3CF663|nr:fimbrial protein [Frateuria soli]UGB38298.1 type 1 fimbrial protein [Frateuria soli]